MSWFAGEFRCESGFEADSGHAAAGACLPVAEEVVEHASPGVHTPLEGCFCRGRTETCARLEPAVYLPGQTWQAEVDE